MGGESGVGKPAHRELLAYQLAQWQAKGRARRSARAVVQEMLFEHHASAVRKFAARGERRALPSVHSQSN